ncbi:MAG: glycoside hydrolase family 57 protein [Nitrospira sp.]|nr:glycoside hydrolase family 57 protein [Nitrospira sp.]MDR4477586.1 glycoside hydrolase family 57 protein [Nitrospira sp.]
MKTIQLCFLWHMHQPYYTDPLTGSASMPWVRLHATKAYYDMAFLLDRFPQARSTFNFTPSLLLQLEEFSAGRVRDLFLEYAQRPAADLTPTEKAFLIRHFFSANWATMVRPFPRYQELLVKRGLDIHGQDLERLSKQFSTQDFLDLQVWHNLAWFGYGSLERFPRLAELRAKNRGFTEEDKREVLALQQTAIRDIIPMYRALQDREQIELTTTPFFHPILPLVIDSEFTRRARPDLPLPARFHAPADAEAQIRRAVEYHTQTFGRAPVGLWPSEGSVCPEILPIVSKAGIRWLATDEGILFRSLQMAGQAWNRHFHLYQPYRVGTDAQPLSMLFRDREISDAFGFIYHKTTPESAADDVLRRIRSLAYDIPLEHGIIGVILDGENPWEHYHDGGERFLSLLFQAFEGDGLHIGHGIRVRVNTIGRAIETAPPRQHLDQLHSGSWINQDFKIWIGHQEDNRGWDLLQHTRARLVEVTPSLSPDRAQAAWDELYAAEGSDWFWWYGDDFDTDYKQEFDRLFRTHLRNVWTYAGMTPPEILNQPLVEARIPQGLDLVHQPLAFITPTLDGMASNFFEWRGAGTINPTPPLGAMWKSEGLFTAMFFGFDREHLYLRLDLDDASAPRQEQCTADLYVGSGIQQYRLSFPLSAAGADTFLLARADESGVYRDVGSYSTICRRKILELGVPFKDLEIEVGTQLRLTLTVSEHGMEIGRYPHHGPATFNRPDDDFASTMWRV